VLPGYWRNSWNSSVILACPLPAKCLGGQNSTCFHGFIGVLCNQCVASVTHMRAIECEDCRVWLMTAQLCAPVVMIRLLRWVILRLAMYKASPNKLFVMKVVLRHCQYLSALCFLKVSFSKVINWSLHVVNWFSTLLISDLPLACVGVPDPEYSKAFIGSLLPLTLLLFELFITQFHQSDPRKYINRILASSILFYTPYITLLTTIPLLACSTVNSTQQLFLDLSETCWEGRHLKYVRLLVLPSVIINVCGPLIAVITYRLFRPLLYYRFFPLWTVGYKVKLYETCICTVQYFFLCTIILTTSLVPLQQVTYCLLILIVMCTANVAFEKQLYTSTRHFLLAQASFLTISLSLGFLSYYIFSLPGHAGSEYFVIAMVLLLNITFFGICVGCLAGNWLNAKKRDTCSILRVPPNTPIVSPELSEMISS